MTTADEVVTALGQLPEMLRQAYPRDAHRGRLEQIEAHAAGLASLIAQLPEEEAREADYEESLLALHTAGKISLDPDLDRTDPQNYPLFAYPDHAFERLRAALAKRGA